MKHFLLPLLLVIAAFSASGQDVSDTSAYLKKANDCFKAGNYICAVTQYKLYQSASGSLGRDVTEQIRKAEECKEAKSLGYNYYKDELYKKAGEQYSIILSLNPDDLQAKIRYPNCLKRKDKVVKDYTGVWENLKYEIIGGKNISFGFTAGLAFANFNAKGSGAVDYGYGSSSSIEPSYSPEAGFCAGMLVDARLGGNYYLQVGLTFTNLKVKNLFSCSYAGYFWYNSRYLEGTAVDNFTEQYTLNYVEIPLLFSSRYCLSKKSNIQFFAGPYVAYGISGKCEITGFTDYVFDFPPNRFYGERCDYTGEMDLFGTSGTSTNSQTTAALSSKEHDYAFARSPFSRINAGVSFGVNVELKGFTIGASYDLGLTNIANDKYWAGERMNITGYKSDIQPKDHKQRVNKFQLKAGYIFRW